MCVAFTVSDGISDNAELSKMVLKALEGQCELPSDGAGKVI